MPYRLPFLIHVLSSTSSVSATNSLATSIAPPGLSAHHGSISQTRQLLTPTPRNPQSNLPSRADLATRHMFKHPAAPSTGLHMPPDPARSTTHLLPQQPLRIPPEPAVPRPRCKHVAATKHRRLSRELWGIHGAYRCCQRVCHYTV